MIPATAPGGIAILDRSERPSGRPPAPADAFAVHGLSHCGLVRAHNEDAWFAESSNGLVVVADGVGGHAGGAHASQGAVHCIADYLRRAASLRLTDAHKTMAVPGGAERIREAQEGLVWRAVMRANRRIVAANAPIGDIRQRQGTTIVGLWAPLGVESFATVFHVGDSRAYLYRDGELGALTRDHSAYRQWLDSGAEGTPPSKSYILQALGLSDVVPDIVSVQTKPGDRFLLCTDGLSNGVEDHEMAALLAKEMSAKSACERLIGLGLSRGGNDNLTTALCMFTGAPRL